MVQLWSRLFICCIRQGVCSVPFINCLITAVVMFNESEGTVMLCSEVWCLDDKDWSRLNVSLRPLRVMDLTLLPTFPVTLELKDNNCNYGLMSFKNLFNIQSNMIHAIKSYFWLMLRDLNTKLMWYSYELNICQLNTRRIGASGFSSEDSFSDYNGSKLGLFCISFSRMSSWFENSRLKEPVQSHVAQAGHPRSAALTRDEENVSVLCRAVVLLGPYEVCYAENTEKSRHSSWAVSGSHFISISPFHLIKLLIHIDTQHVFSTSCGNSLV